MDRAVDGAMDRAMDAPQGKDSAASREGCYSGCSPDIETGMPLCDNCLSIQRDTLGAPGHPALRITDTQRRKLPGSFSETVSMFHCAQCGAVWRYREAKGGDDQGWALLQEGAASESGPFSGHKA